MSNDIPLNPHELTLIDAVATFWTDRLSGKINDLSPAASASVYGILVTGLATKPSGTEAQWQTFQQTLKATLTEKLSHQKTIQYSRQDPNTLYHYMGDENCMDILAAGKAAGLDIDEHSIPYKLRTRIDEGRAVVAGYGGKFIRELVGPPTT